MRARYIFSEFQGGGTRTSAFSCPPGPLETIYNCAAPHRLYDLEKDPDELRPAQRANRKS
ncbi:MAG: hypothetical protein QM757_14880 [Paludibaculum sp.]